MRINRVASFSGRVWVTRPRLGADEIVLLASGSEVHLALDAHSDLAAQGISARVVSVPCLDLFLDQGEKYVRSVIGKDLPKIAIEAGIRQGWSPLLNREDGFVGMNNFGASGPGGELFKHFGITAQAIVLKAKEMLSS